MGTVTSTPMTCLFQQTMARPPAGHLAQRTRWPRRACHRGCVLSAKIRNVTMYTSTPVFRPSKPPTLSAIAVGLAAFHIALLWAALVVGSVGSDRAVLQSILASYGGAVAGLSGFATVYLTSGRSLAALGLRRVPAPWLFLAVGLGAGGFGASILIQDLYRNVFGFSEADTQAVLHVAMQSGIFPFALAFVGGAILTPIGEDFLFRGVIANALNKYGLWAGVGLSALIFGIVHQLDSFSCLQPLWA
ncbi:CPBP family intramembrane metalloprotease [Pseudorhodobacter sp. MZDSW-24AT]|nr:CPBP family intramembrane metalloprotease [Pseudorhodobacter sp. MZDSW-24AT]